MELNKSDTALVVIDPQNDVLSEKGVSWGMVGASIKENNTVENLERLFATAKERGYDVVISPHFLYPYDQAWRFGGVVEKMMLEGKEFFRPDPLRVDGFSGSGADWLERYKPYIEDGKTIVVSPHRVWGPETNDLVLQLRKQRGLFHLQTDIDGNRHQDDRDEERDPPPPVIEFLDAPRRVRVQPHA